MTKTFTQNDLIRYIYHETTEQERIDIEENLLIDPEFFDEYKKLAEISMELDRIDESPSEKTIKKILNYSKSLNLHSVR